MGFQIENGILIRYTEEPGITEVVIPAGVTELATHSFNGCTELTAVTVPEGVTTIGYAVFTGCMSLKTLSLPASLRTIGRTAFYNISEPGLQEITVSTDNPCFCSINGVLYSKDRKKLVCCPAGKTVLTLPAGITEIGESACYGCAKLKQLDLPDTLTKIGYLAFTGCTGLTAVVIPESVTAVFGGAFQFCTGLAEVTLPAGVKMVGDGAFGNRENTHLRVFRLRPDDPALSRDYSKVPKLNKALGAALEMVRTGDYSIPADLTVKYPFVLLHYLHTGDENCAAFIKKSLNRILKDCISAGDTAVIQALTRTDRFITKKNIDKFILQAQNEKQHAIAAFLLDYKNRFIGFSENAGLL